MKSNNKKNIREILHLRAKAWQKTRNFFAERNVLEVDTNILAPGGNPDPHLGNIVTQDGRFLHTSPEFAMKNLLSLGSGDIFQLCRVFRAEENGRNHKNEFVMLEWYRLDFNHWDLMAEVYDFIKEFLPEFQNRPAKYCSYQQLFLDFLQIDIEALSSAELQKIANFHANNDLNLSRDDCLDLLFSLKIQPHLGFGEALFVINYPVSQAALARLIKDENDKLVAARFELFINGLELCNGFWELTDYAEQQKRFQQENEYRKNNNLAIVTPDEILLEALARGLPDCSGVALGIERLLMLAYHIDNIADL